MRSWHWQMLSFQASKRPLKTDKQREKTVIREEFFLNFVSSEFARMCCKFNASFPPILNMKRQKQIFFDVHIKERWHEAYQNC